MANVRDLLQVKGNEIWHISPDTGVLEALRFMAAKDVGALLVLQNDQLVGIISERDFVRSIAETGQCLIHSTVQEYMTKEVFTVGLDQTHAKPRQRNRKDLVNTSTRYPTHWNGAAKIR